MKTKGLLLAIVAVLVLAAPAVAGGQKTLGFTVDELPGLLQASIDRHGTRLKLGKLGVKQDGDQDMFVIRIAPGLLIGGTVERSSRQVLSMVASLDMASAKENTVGLQYIMCATAMIDTCAPDLTGKQRDAILRDVGLAPPSKDIDKVLESTAGTVRYRHLWAKSEATFGAFPL